MLQKAERAQVTIQRVLLLLKGRLTVFRRPFCAFVCMCVSELCFKAADLLSLVQLILANACRYTLWKWQHIKLAWRGKTVKWFGSSFATYRLFRIWCICCSSADHICGHFTRKPLVKAHPSYLKTYISWSFWWLWALHIMQDFCDWNFKHVIWP